MSNSSIRRVRVLINPRSGLWWSSANLQKFLQQNWDVPGIDLSYQYSKSAEDGREKTLRAVEDGVDTVLVVGGDGMVNSIGSALLGTQVALGVIPAGSGNGFARHFDIPLAPEKAVKSLLLAERKQIDVGTVNGRPFFVTCGLAWDAALVRTFEKFPVRGVLPYALSGAYEFLEYRPKPFDYVVDGGKPQHCRDPFVFTVANLTQYGGGAQIAPQALGDDGKLELVVVARHDLPRVIPHIHRLFSGTIDAAPSVTTIRFASLKVTRGEPGPVQVDGELLEEPAEIDIQVLPKAITVLIPPDGTGD